MSVYLVLHYDEPVIAFEEEIDAEDFIDDMVEEGEKRNSLKVIEVEEDEELEEYNLTYDQIISMF